MKSNRSRYPDRASEALFEKAGLRARSASARASASPPTRKSVWPDALIAAALTAPRSLTTQLKQGVNGTSRERRENGSGISRLVLAVFLLVPRILQAQPATNQTHWAFLPPLRPATPSVTNETWVRNEIDRFVLARLEQATLTPSPEADRATLIRRLSFDLIGLPPTPEEVKAFVADNGPEAYEKMVEGLLASPHYGERWGRHWLDVAGYADSNGYFDADTDRPLAYKYRDYVVKAFNDDKPFDRFIEEQIGGDELAGYQADGDVTPEMVEPLIATHFLRNAPDGTGESDGNPLEQKVDRYSVLEGTVQIIGSAFLGLTVQCARCHNHKFEPISQEEYYQLQALLRPAYDPEHWIKPNDRALPVALRSVRQENKRQTEKFERESKALKESLEGLIAPFRKLAVEENLARLEEPIRAKIREAFETKEKQRTEEMKALLKKHETLVQIKDDDLGLRFPDLAASYRALKDALRKKEAERPAKLPQIAVLTEPAAEPPRHHLLVRGIYANEGREVQPGVPAALCSADNRFSLKSSGRRLTFARWLTSPKNPLVARLIVNRIWQRHFGEGLVSTVDNFGVTGAKPTHPELLDYLATEFIGSGWRVKVLQRLIVGSATYRQAGARRATAYAVDPENKLLWRFRLQRLDAESLRDAMLFVAGELDPAIGGPFVPAEKTEEGQFVVPEKNPGAKRRSLYLQQRRTKPVTLLDLFDGAQMNPNCTRRSAATVPLQSLALLNSDFVRARAKALARRLLEDAGDDPGPAIRQAFNRCLGRDPNADERIAAAEFLKTQSLQYTDKAHLRESVWSDFCQMLLASNPFLYVE